MRMKCSRLAILSRKGKKELKRVFELRFYLRFSIAPRLLVLFLCIELNYHFWRFFLFSSVKIKIEGKFFYIELVPENKKNASYFQHQFLTS